jgi:hypothetical protein
MKNRLEGVQHLHVLGSVVAGPDGGGVSLGDVDKSRRGNYGGGRGDGGVLKTMLRLRSNTVGDTFMQAIDWRSHMPELSH